jgi:DNA-binding YbaB/EbfC family protein
MVTVTADGRGEIVAVRIDPEVVRGGDLEMLQDLMMAATNEALRRARELLTSEVGRLTGGLNLPGVM